jgi:hypothetical protein
MIKTGKLYRFRRQLLPRGCVFIHVDGLQKAYDVATTLVVVLISEMADHWKTDPDNDDAGCLVTLFLPDGLVGKALVEQGWLKEIDS